MKCDNMEKIQHNNMSYSVNIYIAGSIKLDEEREKLRLLSNEFNKKISSENKLISFYTYDDKEFRGNQNKIDDFIKNDANIIIFVIDDVMKSDSENEFVLAANTFKIKKQPEIIVYLNKNQNLNPDSNPKIARIQGLMKGALGDNKYYNLYSEG